MWAAEMGHLETVKWLTEVGEENNTMSKIVKLRAKRET